MDKSIIKEVSKRTGHNEETVNYVINRFFYSYKKAMNSRNWAILSIPTMFNIEVSINTINNILKRRHIKILRKDRNNEEIKEDFKRLWNMKQKTITYKNLRKNK